MSDAAVRRSVKASKSVANKKKLCFNEKERSRSFVATDPPSYVSLWRETDPDQEDPLKSDSDMSSSKSSSSAKMESIAAESIKDTSTKPVLEGLNDKELTAKVPPDVIKKDSDVKTCTTSSKSNSAASTITVSEEVLKE